MLVMLSTGAAKAIRQVTRHDTDSQMSNYAAKQLHHPPQPPMLEIRAHVDTSNSLSKRAKKAPPHSRRLSGVLRLTHQYTLASSHGLTVPPQNQGRYYEARRTYRPTAGGRRDTLRPNPLDSMKSVERPTPIPEESGCRGIDGAMS